MSDAVGVFVVAPLPPAALRVRAAAAESRRSHRRAPVGARSAWTSDERVGTARGRRGRRAGRGRRRGGRRRARRGRRRGRAGRSSPAPWWPARWWPAWRRRRPTGGATSLGRRRVGQVVLRARHLALLGDDAVQRGLAGVDRRGDGAGSVFDRVDADRGAHRGRRVECARRLGDGRRPRRVAPRRPPAGRRDRRVGRRQEPARARARSTAPGRARTTAGASHRASELTSLPAIASARTSCALSSAACFDRTVTSRSAVSSGRGAGRWSRCRRARRRPWSRCPSWGRRRRPGPPAGSWRRHRASR